MFKKKKMQFPSKTELTDFKHTLLISKPKQNQKTILPMFIMTCKVSMFFSVLTDFMLAKLYLAVAFVFFLNHAALIYLFFVHFVDVSHPLNA